MAQIEQAKNAKAFADFWAEKGDEKQESQRFWIDLLQNVLGVTAPAKYIEFEKRVQRQSLRIVNEFPAETRDDTSSDKMGAIAKEIHTNYIDAYISDTKVLIEQKGAKIDLHKAYEQSDGSVLTPFEQAKRYVGEMKASEKPRWIVVCNFREFLVYDLEQPHAEPEQILLKDLPRDYYRLQFLVDQKNENIRREEEISIEAGKLVDKLYKALFPQYKNQDEKSLRSLNILCVRIVFCLYAEDAGLFATRTAFEDYIKGFNLPNVRKGLIELFRALDTPLSERDEYDESLKPFPYVNGGLFRDEQIEIPNFTAEIINVICRECAPFNWSEISPTIFGAVFESTLNPETRRRGGMHYTSIANIHKVIDPLFLDDLNAEFEEICGIRQRDVSDCRPQHDRNGTPQHDGKGAAQFGSHSERREESIDVSLGNARRLNMTVTKKQREALHAFQKKLGSLKFLDPACGSGNFLTETYLSLRRLENRVISILNKGEKILGFDEFIKVHINQFYGIEINDFAVTVAKTALWIAESQMVVETEAILSQTIDFLPLKTAANIVEGNALRMDWATLQPLEENAMPADGLFAGFTTQTDGTAHEYDYIMGNPPFVGARWMEAGSPQKKDMETVFAAVNGSGNLDYVSAWYKRADELMKETDIKAAFVSTNSITQGEQAAILWKLLFADGFHIDFAWRTFKWDSESTEKAHVHCVIVGFSHGNSTKTKRIFNSDGTSKDVANINGYLLDASNTFVESVKKPLCDVPEVGIGNKPIDGGNYIFTQEEKDEFLKKEPQAEKYFHRYVGSEEFINNKIRYILYLGDLNPSELFKLPECLKRVEAVRNYRLSSTSAPTIKLAEKPTHFHVENFPKGSYIVIPQVSSERRKYIPIGYLDESVICSDKVRILPNGTLYHFGILTSNVHNAWMRAICCRLKSDYSYTVNNVYNTFPWCNPTDAQKKEIEASAQAILDARSKYADCSLAQLYGDKAYLFPELLKAHSVNDAAVMKAYGFAKTRSLSPLSEQEIVSELFKMYEKLTEEAK